MRFVINKIPTNTARYIYHNIYFYLQSKETIGHLVGRTSYSSLTVTAVALCIRKTTTICSHRMTSTLSFIRNNRKSSNTLEENTTNDLELWERCVKLGLVETVFSIPFNTSSIVSLAQKHFQIGYLCLHSFQYDLARHAFDNAIRQNPNFIYSYLGKMMSYKHTLWSHIDIQSALLVYEQIEKLNLTLKEKDRDYLNTIYQWFAYPSNIRQGMNLNMAREILKKLLLVEPNHPGVLHYLIHVYDVPEEHLYAQAIPYAIKYPLIVTTSSHGHHMPSHIWMRLGYWYKAVLADELAINASITLCQFLLHLTSMIDCDIENRYHSIEWLSYSQLQVGLYKQANSNLQQMISIVKQHQQAFPLFFVYRMFGRQIFETYYWYMYNKDQIKNYIHILQSFNNIDYNPFLNTTDIRRLAWSETGYILGNYLRLLLLDKLSNNSHHQLQQNLSKSIDRLNQLKLFLNGAPVYWSTLIDMTLHQLESLDYFHQQLYQQCLNSIVKANIIEDTMDIIQPPSPPLPNFRSKELMAFFLLMIYKQMPLLPLSQYHLNYASVTQKSNINISLFPSIALQLYNLSCMTTPDRANIILGQARCYVQLNQSDNAKLKYIKILKIWQSQSPSSVVYQEAQTYVQHSSSITFTHKFYFVVPVIFQLNKLFS
ncbi:unnamed protein product [Didymodactylos carnosus]|uniref:Uncharacterized protein n=1 Tax=Didymodactylos carnosus TaxID=1234261 RepID=A0A814UQY2_9BILA|nr:unnamed protein product [Didymodactylos carnosus]CAF3942254.1 unnamed protein product [Didymodactylos carnosus]